MINASAPPGKSDKYALPERERRFLLREVPPAARLAQTIAITDRYLAGTRLRLRQWIETAAGATGTVFKLTQKVPAAGGGPGLLTTIYLTRAEYDVFAALPADVLRKVRHRAPPIVVDVFDPPLDGLVLAEAEFASEDEMRSFTPPAFAIAEVTSDPRFTGGRLAVTAREELLRLLAEFGVRPGD